MIEDSLIRICIPQRRKDAKFGGKRQIFLRKIFTRFFRPLRPWRPFDVAQDMLCERYSEFRLRLFAGGEPLCPSPVWEKACITVLESFHSLSKLFAGLQLSDGASDCIAPRRQARKGKSKFPNPRFVFLGVLCAFAGDIPTRLRHCPARKPRYLTAAIPQNPAIGQRRCSFWTIEIRSCTKGSAESGNVERSQQEEGA